MKPKEKIKEMEKGCGSVYSRGRRKYGNRKEYMKEYVCGKPSLCGYCKRELKGYKQAFADVKALIEKKKELYPDAVGYQNALKEILSELEEGKLK